MPLGPKPDAPLRSHLLFYFSLCIVVSLLAAEAIGLGFATGSLFKLTGSASQLLTTQASNALCSAIVSNSAQLFEDVLNNILYAAGEAATAAGDSFRSDYSAGPEPSFYGMPAFLENPVMQPPNAPQFGGMNVSETHSVWILANNTSPTPPPLSPEQTSTLNAIAHVDMFVRPVYRMNPEVLSVQWGFENALFKSFPGTGDNLNQGPYDPRVRSWYTGAKLNQLTPSSFVVVDPYLSAFGRGWVMTTAKSIFSSQNGSFIGVASIQTQLSEFSKLLSSFAYEGANVGIYKATATGTMLASTQVVFDNTAPGTTPATYANTSSPNLSTAFWTGTIVPSLSANINTVTSNYGSATYVDPSTGTSYLVLWKTLSVYATDSAQSASNPSWVVVGAVPLAQLQSTVDAATSALKASLPLILGVGAGIFIAVLAVVLLLVRVFANRVARPLAKLCAETDVISNNIGAADLFAGVDVAGKGGEEARSGVDEMDAFREGFYAMVATIREGSVRVGKKGEMGSNAVFQVGEGQLPELIGESGIESRSVIELLPDVPPQYEEIEMAGVSTGYQTFGAKKMGIETTKESEGYHYQQTGTRVESGTSSSFEPK